MRRLLKPLALSLLLIAATGLRASEKETKQTPQSQLEQARAWIARLGDRSYRVREQAEKELLKLGKAIKPLLEEAAKSKDAETARRAKKLLDLANRSEVEVALDALLNEKDPKLLLKLPAWQRFSKYMGDTVSARQTFVEMYSGEAQMFQALESDPRGFAQKFQQYCVEIQRSMYDPTTGQARQLSTGKVLALLFLATDPRVSTNTQSFYTIRSLLYQPTIQEKFKSDTGARKLLMAFLESRTDRNMLQQSMYIAQQLELKEAVPLALKLLEDRALPIYSKSQAILFVGKVGGREHAKAIEPYLNDNTTVGTLRNGQLTVSAKMSDVALAALIMSEGQDPADYGFPYLAQFRNVNVRVLQLSPSYFGFADDKQRADALKRWKTFQEARKKEEKKEENKEAKK